MLRVRGICTVREQRHCCHYAAQEGRQGYMGAASLWRERCVSTGLEPGSLP